MSITFNNETHRDDFTFRNSTRAIRRYPFPFGADSFEYAINIEDHIAGKPGSCYEHPIDVDEHYLSEMADRALVLKADPLRCQALEHMMPAQWDTLELLMTCKAKSFPDHFTLEKDGNKWHWINRPMNIENHFTFGDRSTLPYEPFEYITRQAQGDFCIVDQRDGSLWMDAGMVTAQADWSLDFDLGMNFMQWHAPVPLAHEAGVFDRALKFLMNIQQGRPTRRLNWTMTVNPRLDTSPENYDKWGRDKATITPENIGAKLHLRCELQSFWRLPRSNALLFPIRQFLISFDDIATIPKWACRMHRVLKSLPEPIIDYKGLRRNHQMAIDYFAPFDHGQTLTNGGEPE